MPPPALFNTLLCDLHCPHCQNKIISGIGFRLGSLERRQYKLGDTLNWQKAPCRPDIPPKGGNIITLGHFNCDNPRCPTWQDCYPDIQTVKITIKKDKIIDVVIHNDAVPEEFAILEPPLH